MRHALVGLRLLREVATVGRNLAATAARSRDRTAADKEESMSEHDELDYASGGLGACQVE